MTPDTDVPLPESGICHFRISGAWLTEHVRERILSDMEDSALLLLVNDLHGMTHDIAVSILLGKKRLAGDTGDPGGIYLDDEDPVVRATWEQTLRERYGTRCELQVPGRSSQRGWFRPHAYVTDFGPNDVGDSWTVRGIPIGRKDRARFGQTRIQHYAYADEVALSTSDDGGIDPVVAFGGRGIPGLDGPAGGLGWIFEPVAYVPAWIRHLAAKSPTEALASHVGAGWGMEARGHSSWYPGAAQERGAALRATLADGKDQIAKRIEPDNPAAAATLRREAANLRGAIRPDLGDLAQQVVDRMVKRAGEGESARRDRLAELAAQIREKAGPIDGPGWFTLTIMEGAPAEFTVRVPLAPFSCWALWRTSGAHLMPEYVPVCESGLRLFGDDPYHSDWMLGAFPDQEVGHTYQDEEIRRASYRAAGEIQERLLGFSAAVLSGRGSAHGIAIHPAPGDMLPPGSIAILPNARPEYESVVRQAGATIVPVGGELCHLATVATEAGHIIVRVEECLTLYPPGTPLRVDADAGRVDIDKHDVRGAFGPL